MGPCSCCTFSKCNTFTNTPVLQTFRVAPISTLSMACSFQLAAIYTLHQLNVNRNYDLRQAMRLIFFFLIFTSPVHVGSATVTLGPILSNLQSRVQNKQHRHFFLK